jgi:hypothetical protein
MTNVNKTNRFFKENVYSNLAGFALSPVSWAFETKSHGSVMVALPDFGKLLLAALLAPILVPATIATSAIALCLAGISALFHGLSLMVAGIADACSNADDRTMSPV